MRNIFADFKNKLAFIKNNYQDTSVNSKVLIIESDDWGSIRMPSRESYENLLKNGIPVDKCPFLKFDSFETVADFESLYSCLSDFKDTKGNQPVITANFILANPDFRKIEESNFSEYHREFFWDFLKKSDLLIDYKLALDKGIKNKYIRPQLHGLEHLNVPYWISCLNFDMKETKVAFSYNVYGISTTVTKENRRTYLAALDYKSQAEFENYTKPSLVLAYKEFEGFFGYKSKSFIAPNYVWSEQVEQVLLDLGLESIQSSRFRKLPVFYNSKGLKQFTGVNTNGFACGVRNVLFEPSVITNKKLHLEKAVNDINMAFKFNKLAIISSHRLNFMGSLENYNRYENLQLLHELISRVQKKWPQIEFQSSDNLINII